MKRILFALAITVLLIPIRYPLHGQDGGFGGGGDSIDVTGLIGDRGGRGGGFGGPGNNGRGAIEMPTSKDLLSDIQSALKKGKTPLDKSQEKPLKSMIDQEIVNLSDRIQLLRQNNNNNNNFDRGPRDFGGGFPPGGFPPDGGFPGGGGFPPGGFPGGGGGFPPDGGFPGGGGAQRGGNAQGNADQPGGNGNNNNLANTLAVQTETITSLKNDDFLDNKLPAFLTSEQVALIQKVRSADKQNATCLGGLLDRISPLNQNNNGGRGNNNRGNFNNNFNFNNNSKKTNGQDFCMTAEATASERLEPIRKELAKGNLPLAKDKETIAEVFMKSQMKDLGDALRATLTANFSGNRGGGNSANRNTNPQLVIQSSTDEIYKKAAAMLNPQQSDSLKKWHYEQILNRGGIEAVIGIEAMQSTPLTDEQIARLTAAWPEVRNQMQSTAKSANKNISPKELDNAAMSKILDMGMLEPPQITSFQQANKMVSGK